jgi:hypothetical protein
MCIHIKGEKMDRNEKSNQQLNQVAKQPTDFSLIVSLPEPTLDFSEIRNSSKLTPDNYFDKDISKISFKKAKQKLTKCHYYLLGQVAILQASGCEILIYSGVSDHARLAAGFVKFDETEIKVFAIKVDASCSISEMNATLGHELIHSFIHTSPTRRNWLSQQFCKFPDRTYIERLTACEEIIADSNLLTLNEHFKFMKDIDVQIAKDSIDFHKSSLYSELRGTQLNREPKEKLLECISHEIDIFRQQAPFLNRKAA